MTLAGVQIVRKALKSGEMREYYYYRAHGRRVTLPGPLHSVAFHEALRAARAGCANFDAVPEHSVRAAVTAYLSSPRFASCRPRTRAGYSALCSEIVDYFGDLGLEEFSRGDFIDISAGYVERGHPAKARSILSMFSILFSFALKDLRWIDDHPLVGLASGARKPRGLMPITPEQLRQLRQANPMGTRERLLVELGFATAARRAALLEIPMREVLGQHITFQDNKNGDPVVVPVTPELRVAAQSLVANLQAEGLPEPEFAICNLKTGGKVGTRWIHAVFLSAREKAGLRQITLHGLRYASAAALLQAGVPLHVIRHQTGHRTLSMAEHYAEKMKTLDRRESALSQANALSNGGHKKGKGP